MKGFTKAALAAAIATAPMAGFAMDSLEDEALSAVTGQDGISIDIASTSIGYIKLIDQDNGVASSTDANGAIFISGFSQSGTTSIDIDADENTIQAAITLGSGTIGLGAISATATGATTGGTTLLNLGSMNHGDITLNVQLGDEDQGDMIALSGTVTSGISITGFSISDTNSSGSIGGDLSVVTNGSANLTLDGKINATSTGLQISGLGAMDITLTDLNLGSATSAGDLVIGNLQVGTITISGKL